MMWFENDVLDNRYVIKRRLGYGGTGVVYLAYHLNLQKLVVLKRLKIDVVDLKKVRTETDILKGLHHACLPQVYDFMCVGDEVYTVIDYIEGYDLKTYIDCGTVFTQEQLQYWLRQLCDVLHYLHTRRPKVLHCDIKPANVMLTPEGNVCLIDFNISINPDAGEPLKGLSQEYASPEQYEKAMSIINNQPNNTKINEQTDIYSLGATFYHMISGLRPIAHQANYRLSEVDHLPFTRDFLQIIDKMMSVNRRTRYKSAAEVCSALDKLEHKNESQKKLFVRILSASVAYLLVLTAGIWLCVYGYDLQNEERYNRDYASFYASYNNASAQDTVDKGIALLNDSGFAEKLTEDSGMKFDILCAIAESFFYEESYINAEFYYNEALKCSVSADKRKDCMRDYIITLIREGKEPAARNMLQTVENTEIMGADLLLIQAEMLNMQNQYARALQNVTAILKQTNDRELLTKTYLLGGSLNGMLGNCDQQIVCYEKLVAFRGNSGDQRRLADAYLQKRETLPDTYVTQIENYYWKAASCYEKVLAQDSARLSDILNCAIVYLQLTEYEKCIALLADVDAEFEKDYRVSMYLCFAYEGIKDSVRTREYCNTAIALYENTPAALRENAEQGAVQHLYNISNQYR